MRILPTIILLFILTFAPRLVAAPNEADVLDFLKQQAPEIYMVLVDLKESDPLDFEDAMRDATRTMTEFQRVQTFSSLGATSFLEMERLDFQIISKADDYVLSSDEAEKTTLQKEIKILIGQSFDYWKVYENARLKKLEDDLKDAREKFEDAIQSKANVIEADTKSVIQTSREYQKEKQAKLKGSPPN